MVYGRAEWHLSFREQVVVDCRPATGKFREGFRPYIGLVPLGILMIVGKIFHRTGGLGRTEP